MIKEQDLKRNYKAVVIGGSAGSFQVLCQILNQVPLDFPLPIIICSHRLKDIKHGFVEALALSSLKKIEEPDDKDKVKAGHVYLAPANYHMSIELGNTFALSTEEMIHSSRPSIDITFDSAAYTFKEKMIGIILTGANRDGAAGLNKVKKTGALTIVQDPKDSAVSTMPEAALSLSKPDYILKVDQIIRFFHQLYKHQGHEKAI
jgi:two-component system chemotaxis response regulator CheB